MLAYCGVFCDWHFSGDRLYARDGAVFSGFAVPSADGASARGSRAGLLGRGAGLLGRGVGLLGMGAGLLACCRRRAIALWSGGTWEGTCEATEGKEGNSCELDWRIHSVELNDLVCLLQKLTRASSTLKVELRRRC